MAHTRSRRRHPFRSLRREAPSIVAVLAARTDFAAMTGYRTFAFRDHDAYLRQTEVLLRALASQGVHARVAFFDTGEYALFCEEERLDPDSAASRTRYAAEVAAAGVTVPYEGQRIDELVPLLLDAHASRRTWEEVTALLADAGGGTYDSGPPAPGQAAFDRAAEALTRLLEAAGSGTHHVVCSVHPPGTAAPLCAALRVERVHDGRLRMADSEALLLCGVLAAGLATGSPGGVVLRSELRSEPAPPSEPPGPETVRGWCLRDGWLRPLTEAEVFAAYCTDADTGEPVPPEPGVSYAAGYALPRRGGEPR
ncbi:hypothetical protein DVA86_23900 [Streptomyces armeniacus]|uniref:Uncharacterized protein n=1 Tax=Streptomyces armeniacus TaxID=83291 RepID=A0A345XUB1_9ACTN|nr:hypothetical protein [Streptomyces armeniacus]AXK35227.1 hypothetical protein DVA86_23900 [Streptomyces armeniacus]